MNRKDVTIEDLARMIQKGFEETAKKKEVDNRFKGVNKRFDDSDKRFNGLDNQLERIEKLLIVDHRERIKKLEIEVRRLNELLAVR